MDAESGDDDKDGSAWQVNEELNPRHVICSLWQKLLTTESRCKGDLWVKLNAIGNPAVRPTGHVLQWECYHGKAQYEIISDISVLWRTFAVSEYLFCITWLKSVCSVVEIVREHKVLLFSYMRPSGWLIRQIPRGGSAWRMSGTKWKKKLQARAAQ